MKHSQSPLQNHAVRPARLLAGLALLASLLLPAAGQSLVNLDVNHMRTNTSPAVLGAAGDTWNGIPGAYNPVVTYLKNSAGFATALSVAVEDDFGYYFNAGGSIPTSSATADLLGDYLDVNGGAMTLTLSGLLPNTAYDLIVYSVGDTAGQGGSFSGAITATTDASQRTSYAEGVNYVRNSAAVADADGNLQFQIANWISSYAAFNGLQIQGNIPYRLLSAAVPFVDPGQNVAVRVTLPAGANASVAATVYVTNDNPAVVSIPGAVNNILAVTFAAGATNVQSFNAQVLAVGEARLNCATTGGAGPLPGNVLKVGGLAPRALTEVFAASSLGLNPDDPVYAWTALTNTAAVANYAAGDACAYHANATPSGAPAVLFTNGTLILPGYYSPVGGLTNFSVALVFKANAAGVGAAPPAAQWGAQTGILDADEAGVANSVANDWGIALDSLGEINLGVGNPDVTVAQYNYNTVSPLFHAAVFTFDALNQQMTVTVDDRPRSVSTNVLSAKPRNFGDITFGGSSRTTGRYFVGELAEIRFYNGALSAGETTNLLRTLKTNYALLWPSEALLSLTPANSFVNAGASMNLLVTIPAVANQSQPVAVSITNNNPTALNLPGAVNHALIVNFPAGSTNVQAVAVQGLATGVAGLSYGAPGLVSGAAATVVVGGRTLLGHWLSGTESLSDTAGFMPAGTHDGVPVTYGYSPGIVSWLADVPPGRTGSSLSLDPANGPNAVMITNTDSGADSSYQPTFDNLMAYRFTISLWYKTWPTNENWIPWVSKKGESNLGYQVRRRSSSGAPTFTIRGTPGTDDPTASLDLSASTGWHHVVASWDGGTGIRDLYVDGLPCIHLEGDFGPMAIAPLDHLMLGAMDNNNALSRFDYGQLYDVRIYSYAMNFFEVNTLFKPPTGVAFILTSTNSMVPGASRAVGVAIPENANQSQAVTVTLTNNSPGVVAIAGATLVPGTTNVYTVTFAAGGATVTTLTLTALAEGQIDIVGVAPGLTAAAMPLAQVVTPHLIGRWLAGAQNLADVSGFTPAGTHDGVARGTHPLAFSADVPPSFSGYSLDLSVNTNTTGYICVGITNSAQADQSYQPTFDTNIAYRFSMAFWAKGFTWPTVADWGCLVSKNGEGSVGWQVRRYGNNPYETFTIRGTPGTDDPGGSLRIDDGQWHHFAAAYDGDAGTRKCYVDGVLDPNINLFNDFGPCGMASAYRLTLGARDQGGANDHNAIFAGLLYDVRVYDYALSSQEVLRLFAVPAPSLQIGVVGSTVQISWPAPSTGYVLETSTSVSGGWSPSGLTVTTQNGRNIAADTLGAGARFYRLHQQ